MEATGVSWKPVWFVLDDAGFELRLVNSRNMRMVPGRQTDVADAAWIAQLLEVGLLPGNYVPPPVIRELRDLTRYHKRLVQDRTREGSGWRRCSGRRDQAGLGRLADPVEVPRVMIEALIAGEGPNRAG